MKTVKERPIIFNTEMVKAILDDIKTQTRRINGLKTINENPSDYFLRKIVELDDGTYAYFCDPVGNYIHQKSPYGKIGDRLWVRETWSHGCNDFGTNRFTVHYRADGLDHKGHRWSPSIFMPRKRSRITLEITDIRVERIQDISEQDAIAEGVIVPKALEILAGVYGPTAGSKYIVAFRDLWDSINAKPKPVMSGKKIVSYISCPWDEIRETRDHRGLKWIVYGNPHVWAVTFKVLKKEV